MTAEPERLPVASVHAWQLPLADVPIGPDSWVMGTLAAEEVHRADQFVHAEDRRACLVTRALVRTLLGRYTGVAPAAWRFSANHFGRLEIAAPVLPTQLRFNVSHTRKVAVAALAWQHDLGIDVEDVTRPLAPELLDVALVPHERRAVLAAPVAQRAREFFRYWTLKEAYTKARGLGLQLPLQSFGLRLPAREGGAITLLDDAAPEPDAWRLWSVNAPCAHVMAIAVKAIGCELVIREARPDRPGTAAPTTPASGW